VPIALLIALDVAVVFLAAGALLLGRRERGRRAGVDPFRPAVPA
jgi:hypothetical protein